MSSNNSIILLDVKLKEEKTSLEMATLLAKLEYSDEEGIGFRNISNENDQVIVGEALKKTPIFINLLNPVSQEIEKKEEFVLSEIEFTIDLKYSILEVYSSHRDLKKLQIIFRSLAKDTISISQLDFSLSQLMFALKENAKIVEIRKMCIKDFQYEPGIIGTYDVTFYNPENAWLFLNRYQTGINSVTFYISNDEWEIMLTIRANGQIKFNNKSKNAISGCLELLKSLIIKSNYHA